VIYKPQVGERVKAFHPRMVGVVKEGTITSINRKSVRIDFGPLLGGIRPVSPQDIVERA
jgi:hypothetical protein